MASRQTAGNCYFTHWQMRTALLVPFTTLTVGLVLVCSLMPASTAHAAVLPDHSPVSILIIADEVNPHRLTDAQLTQPQDLAPAITAADSPLQTSSVITVNSQCADQALTALRSDNPPDAVLYFAHRAALLCDGTSAQSALTALLASGLQQGLGIVVLRHGLYVDIFTKGAKDELLNLIGAQTNSIKWDTEQGQRVFNVGGAHFVSSNGLEYRLTENFSGTPGVSSGPYPYFVNLPDELYSDTRLLIETGETRTPLFASDSQGERLLGYVLTRPGWTGRVVAYQPGEYQPNALDDHQGPNYQILMNALYFAVFGE